MSESENEPYTHKTGNVNKPKSGSISAALTGTTKVSEGSGLESLGEDGSGPQEETGQSRTGRNEKG